MYYGHDFTIYTVKLINIYIYITLYNNANNILSIPNITTTDCISDWCTDTTDQSSDRALKESYIDVINIFTYSVSKKCYIQIIANHL